MGYIQVLFSKKKLFSKFYNAYITGVNHLLIDRTYEQAPLVD
jgi:hypothetical protein